MRALGLILPGLVLLAIWQGLVSALQMPAFILPSPLRTLDALIANRALIAGNAAVTLAEVLAGMVAGSLAGALTALLLSVSATARLVIRPLLIVTQALPVFALAPILTLWMGYGIGSKVVMTVLIIYFPVASAFYDGLRGTPSGWLDLAASMQATPARTLWHVRVPAALPSLASGLRLAAVYAPIGAVIGEWVGASKGLGYLMLMANGRSKIDLMFAALIVLCAMTLLLHRGIGFLADRLTARLG